MQVIQMVKTKRNLKLLTYQITLNIAESSINNLYLSNFSIKMLVSNKVHIVTSMKPMTFTEQIQNASRTNAVSKQGLTT